MRMKDVVTCRCRRRGRAVIVVDRVLIVYCSAATDDGGGLCLARGLGDGALVLAGEHGVVGGDYGLRTERQTGDRIIIGPIP